MLHRRPDKRIMPDVWMGPGGKREFNEGLFEATRREVLEETGLHIKNLRIKVAGNAYVEDLEQEFFFHFVFADYESGEVHQHPEDGELVWLTPEEILSLDNILAEIRELGPALFEDDGRVLSYSALYGKGNSLKSFQLEQP